MRILLWHYSLPASLNKKNLLQETMYPKRDILVLRNSLATSILIYPFLPMNSGHWISIGQFWSLPKLPSETCLKIKGPKLLIVCKQIIPDTGLVKFSNVTCNRSGVV